MFRIGDFSHIARVSTRLLRYYDKLGLLEPGFVDPHNGYRFYTADQLPQLNRILALKEMGLSLDEVESMIDVDIPADQLRGMLTLKASELAREIEVQQARMRFIESRIDQIETGGHQVDFLTKHVDAQPFLSVRDHFASMPDIVAFSGQMLEAAKPIADRLPSPCLTALWHDDWADIDIDIEIGLLGGVITTELEIDGGRILAPTALPAIDVLSTVRTGLPDINHGLYAAAGRWIESNNVELAGPIREVIMQRPGPGVDAIVEVQFPIHPKPKE
jgi:DNA-binding transcriptional MerR regulator/effector-binding domain-containing protein